MTTNRNASGHQKFRRGRKPSTTFKLDHVCPCLHQHRCTFHWGPLAFAFWAWCLAPCCKHVASPQCWRCRLLRYTGASLSFNLSAILGASFAPYNATWLATNQGLQYVGYYLSGMASISVMALWAVKKQTSNFSE